MDERTQAAAIADRLLDESYADPDDDIRVVCRQFNRSQEQIGRLYEMLRQASEELLHCDASGRPTGSCGDLGMEIKTYLEGKGVHSAGASGE